MLLYYAGGMFLNLSIIQDREEHLLNTTNGETDRFARQITMPHRSWFTGVENIGRHLPERLNYVVAFVADKLPNPRGDCGSRPIDHERNQVAICITCQLANNRAPATADSAFVAAAYKTTNYVSFIVDPVDFSKCREIHGRDVDFFKILLARFQPSRRSPKRFWRTEAMQSYVNSKFTQILTAQAELAIYIHPL